MKLEDYYAQGFEDTIKAAQQQPHPREKEYAEAKRKAGLGAFLDGLKFNKPKPQQTAKSQPPPKATAG